MSSGRRVTNVRLTIGMIIGHVAALVFGLLGLLIAVPNPHLWADSEFGVRVYSWGMQYAGGSHILFAAVAMLLAGFRFLGTRRTVWFFAITCVATLSAELLGTTTGFPFGDYQYTSGLGFKILGEVPFTIPLSWFYMGLASYLLAIVLVGTGPGWRRPVGSILLGSTLLTIWDLVLDPAMAHQDLGVRFWVWDQTGIYFDMPAQNFLGWVLTGIVFMGLSRLIWGTEPRLNTGLIRIAYVIYLANLIFAMVISAAVGLWWPVLITIVIGVLPATIALIAAEGWSGGTSGRPSILDDDTVQRVARGVMTLGARIFLARSTSSLRVDGMSNIPATGPALLVARHYHHLLDGCSLQVSLPRPMHTLVAIDWVDSERQRSMLESACRMARWPMVIRPDADGARQFSEPQRTRILRDAFRQSAELLAEGRLLTIFPEGYPTIDPHGSRKPDPDTVLPFDPGFSAIARAAERVSGFRIPIVPVGFDYTKDSGDRWAIDLRVGAPVYLDSYADEESMIVDISRRVSALSAPDRSAVPSDSMTMTETS